MQNYSEIFSSINITFLGIIVFVWIVLYHKNRIELLPNLATSLGVLGTFVGIFWGLYKFEVLDITASVPHLLSGMKFAFVTSIIGMSIAFFYKFPLTGKWKYFNFKDDKGEKKEGATVDTLAKLLSEIKESNDENSKSIISKFEETANKQEGSLKQIEKALVGDGETTLITQKQKLRTTTIDKFDDQINAFNTFAEKMADNNSKALIDALKNVMEDFNAKLSQYVGDNFKKLSESIDRMIDWQNLYKEQMDKMAKQIENAMLAIDNSEQVIEKIVEQASKFSETAKDLDNIMIGLYDIKDSLQKELEAFSELANNAKNAFPMIEKSITDLTENLGDAVREIMIKNKTMLDEQRRMTTETITHVTNSLNDQKEKIQRNQELVNQTLHKTIGDVSQRIDRFTNEFSSIAADKLKKLDESMSEELNKSIRTLGSNLASLSNKFVQDYSPLTDRLREILEIAERAQGDGR